MNVQFVAGFGPIVPDDRLGAASSLYEGVPGIALEHDGYYLHTGALEGAKHFALWPLSQAAESCFGRAEWPSELPVPQAWLEFDVEDVGEATRELERAGYRLLVANREEPWGQAVTRLLSPEGLLVGVTRTPWPRGT